MFAHSSKILSIFKNELHLEDDKADELARELDETISSFQNERLNNFITRAELQLLENKMDTLIQQIREKMATKDELRELDNKVEQIKQQIAYTLVTKEEMHLLKGELKTDMLVMEGKLRTDMHTMEDKLRTDIHTMGDKLNKEIKEVSKSQTFTSISASVATFFAIVGALWGIIYFFFKK